MDYKRLGHNIKQQRKSLNLTQQQVADKTGFALNFIGNIERGERKVSVDTLAKIADCLDISVDSLLDNSQPFSEAAINNELNSLISKCSSNERYRIIKMIRLMFPHL